MKGDMQDKNSNYFIGEAPTEKGDFEFFIYHNLNLVGSREGYCGAYCDRGKDNKQFFLLPGAIRDDGLFSDPLKARAALNKFLEELK